MPLCNKILIGDDDPAFCEIAKALLEKEGYNVAAATTYESILENADTQIYDLVLLDLKLKDKSGVDILKHIKNKDPDIMVIMITSFATIQTAVESIKIGAYDYLTKDIENEELLLKIEHALEHRKNTLELRTLKEALGERYSFHNIIGSNKTMQEVYNLINSVCNTDVAVLILGETGTGKELVAKAIHFNSLRKEKPFFAINCAAISETLTESELFGHEKGSFTGAYKQRIGKLELANEGSVFLDEIGDMNISLQAKVLRFLQDKSFERIGGEKTLSADVRIIAATNKDLETMIEEKKFREDLFYRINTIQINLPPLRERIDDISLLAEHFIKVFNNKHKKSVKGLTKGAIETLTEYNWPGNVRELENLLEKMIILVPDRNIDKNDIEKFLLKKREAPARKLDINVPLGELKNNLEKEYITALLKKYQGNIVRVAEKTGLSRAAIYQKMEKYNLSKIDFKPE